MKDQLAKELGVIITIVILAIICMLLISAVFGNSNQGIDFPSDESQVNNEVTVLAFVATGCKSCQRIRPILVAIRTAGVRVDIMDINTRTGATLAHQVGVTSVPTFFVRTKSNTTRTQNIHVVLRIIAENKK